MFLLQTWMLVSMFVACLLATVADAQSLTTQRFTAITLDDLPKAADSSSLAEAQRVTTALLNALKRHQAPAIGFINESKCYVTGQVDARIALLQQWVDAGMTLGNHTYSHLSLQETPLMQYEDEVIRGEVITRRLMKPRGPYQLYFRHPFTSTGPTKEVKAAFERFLEARGYKIAPFTVEHADYSFNEIYREARKDHDDTFLKRIRDAYLTHLETMFSFFEQLSQDTFGREIKQILLIHANEINADCLDEMLTKLEGRGYHFITLDEALDDKAYQTRDDYVGPMGISWLHRWTVSLGIKMNFDREPDPPKWVVAMYKKVTMAAPIGRPQ